MPIALSFFVPTCGHFTWFVFTSHVFMQVLAFGNQRPAMEAFFHGLDLHNVSLILKFPQRTVSLYVRVLFSLASLSNPLFCTLYPPHYIYSWSLQHCTLIIT